MALKKLGGGQGLLKAGFLGFQGSGKTYSACLLACAVRRQFKLKGPIAMIDSENATAYVAPLVKQLSGDDLVGDRTRDFNALITLTEECVKEGVSVLVADSMTHFWRNLCDSYLAGVNEHRERKGWSPRKKLEFQDWAELKGQWSRWTNLFLNAPLHIIICGRAGYEYDMEKDEETGKKELIKTGIKMKTEGEFGFEPSLLVQMELEQQPIEDGKFKQVRTATVLKDRFGIIDGSVFQFSKGKDRLDEMERVWSAFEGHVGSLMPGAHSTVMTATTPMPVSEEGDAEWAREKKARTILCEEIQGCIVEKFPGQSADEKKAKANLLAQVFGTRSWTAVESMNSDTLRLGLDKLRGVLGLDTPMPKNETDDVNWGPAKAPINAPDPSGGSQTPSGGSKPQEAGVPKQDDPLTQLRGLLKALPKPVTEAHLLSMMAELGHVPYGLRSLDEVKNLESLRPAIQHWEILGRSAMETMK